jgi:hypothetical protein
MQHPQPTRGDKVRETFKQKRARGEVTGRVPLGYKVVYDECGKNGRVVVDQDVMPLLAEAKALRQTGASLRTIQRVMASRGLRLSHVTVSGILRSIEGSNCDRLKQAPHRRTAFLASASCQPRRRIGG